MAAYILAIDQGTTSTRSILFDQQMNAVATAQIELPQHYPQSGWVEHEASDIWKAVVETGREVLNKASTSASQVAGIGITNQRETVVVWDRSTGRPIHNAIVWQDRRTSAACQALREAGVEPQVTAATGLLLDPYFSASKLTWLLDNVEGARRAAESGDLAFGTIDSYLLWQLTGGRVHATDVTNASRTLLYDIHRGEWSRDMLELFRIPASLLPKVMDNAASFGETEPALFGAGIPVSGMAGDQQAATIGQACFRPGMMKSTYGTGCFAVLNTGETPVSSGNRLLTTIAYRLNGKTTYALEGSIFVAGAAVQWLRDGLGLIERADQSGPFAEAADPGQRVYLVPAFVGLGAPYWDAEARGALFGLTRATGPREFARAALESVCYQTRDLLEAMRRDWPEAQNGDEKTTPGGTVLRVDGGMVASDWTMQRLADLTGAPVDRPHVLETTALGAAYLAGMEKGLYAAPDAFAAGWSSQRRFSPEMTQTERDQAYAGWQDAVRRVLTQPVG